MKVDFDPIKNERNIKEANSRSSEPRRSISILRWCSQTLERHTAKPVILLCSLDRRLHVLCSGIRVISFRKANAREVIRYGKPQATD